jgi:hypothetical protein
MIAWAIQLLWLLFALGVIVAVVLVALWFIQTILEIPLPQRAIRVVWGLVALLVLIGLLTWLSGGIAFNFPKLG